MPEPQASRRTDTSSLPLSRELAVSLAKAVGNYGAGPLLGRTCAACGHRTLLRRSGTFPPTLAREWRLSPRWEQWFVERETRYCLRCKSNLRSRQLASVLVAELNTRLGVSATSLAKLCNLPAAQWLKVAEINGAGRLHPMLAELPGLAYSEYGSTNPAVPSEDLTALSYASNHFDVVITSDTLEHIPDVDCALQEIWRVLAPGGQHIFTIPVIWDRAQTLQRARLSDGALEHLAPPSYHGESTKQTGDLLVFWEFGSDIVERIRACGFEVRVVRDPSNEALAVFVATKV